MNFSSLPPNIPSTSLPIQDSNLASEALTNESWKILKNFVASHCQNISFDDAKRMITDGKKVAEDIVEKSQNKNEWVEYLNGLDSGDNEGKGKAAAVNLIWFLTWCTACNEAALKSKFKEWNQNELYISGSLRISGETFVDKAQTSSAAAVKGATLREFLRACSGATAKLENGSIKQTGGMAYSRISSHMGRDLQERQKKGLSSKEVQYGFDIRRWTSDSKTFALPVGKGTILFDALSDKTTFIKLEKHGCPPIWTRKFCNFANIKEFLEHAASFILSRKFIQKIVKNITGIFSAKNSSVTSEQPLSSRKEHVLRTTIGEFEEIMDKSPSLTDDEKKKYIQQVEQYGETRAAKIFDDMIDQAGIQINDGIQTLSDSLKKMKKYKEEVRYQGKIQGDEVLLSSLNELTVNIRYQLPQETGHS